jgi:hypothetical protein
MSQVLTRGGRCTAQPYLLYQPTKNDNFQAICPLTMYRACLVGSVALLQCQKIEHMTKFNKENQGQCVKIFRLSQMFIWYYLIQ